MGMTKPEAGFATMAAIGTCLLGSFFGIAAVDRFRGNVEQGLTKEIALRDSASAIKLNPNAFLVEYSARMADPMYGYTLEREAFEKAHPKLTIHAVLDPSTDDAQQRSINGLGKEGIHDRQLVFIVTQKKNQPF